MKTNEGVEKRRINFKYHDINAQTVFLSGSFNGWNSEATPMKKHGEGVWLAVVNLFPGIYEYRFFVDGLWKNDPVCDQHQLNRYGDYNCVLRIA